MEETSENNKVKETPFFFHSSCNYCQEFIRAILRCLGLESEPRDSSAEQPADPPSSMADPPPQPPISGGRGPQTN
ncbi:hypothetical protein CDL12_23059 [Handroanthus impetiginosus]|uniref:Uncharacterized protein n=1 Tax=Handroanthus impetiginosus TaxID=429701 RepID=A0A2G9GGJ5_9LAMI|nr:hypothetical protein CDL12_23059 [Handroanthus impetiginosus]